MSFDFDSIRPRHTYPEVLLDIANACNHTLQEHDIPDELATQISIEVADRISELWGGQNVYIPMGLFARLSDRDHKIYARFNGSNHRQLSRDFRIGLTRIYRIIKIMRKQQHDSLQPALF